MFTPPIWVSDCTLVPVMVDQNPKLLTDFNFYAVSVKTRSTNGGSSFRFDLIDLCVLPRVEWFYHALVRAASKQAARQHICSPHFFIHAVFMFAPYTQLGRSARDFRIS